MDKLLGKLAPHFIKNGFEKVMSDEDGDLLYVQKEIYGNHFDLGVDNKGLVHTVANDTDDAIQFKSLEQLDLFILGLMEYRKVFTEGYGDFLEKEIEVLDDVEDK